MADLMLTCDLCRHRMRVSEFQLGMAIVCPDCKAELTISEANTIPLEVKAPAVEYEPFAAKSASDRAAQERGVERCERCDAAIRGDWDRYETDAGVWCHRCVNRARSEDEEEVRVVRRGGSEAAAGAAAVAEPGNFVPEGVDDTPLTPEDIMRLHTEKARAEWEAKQPKDERPAFMRKYPQATKIAMWSLIGGVFLATAYYFFLAPDTGTQVVERDSEVVRAIGNVPIGIQIGLSMGFWLLATVIPLYGTLYLANKLPTGALLPDLVHITAISLLLSLLAMITVVPLLGHLLFLFVGILILWSVYEMNISDFVTWLMIAFLVRYLVLMPLESRILYSIGQLTN